MAIQGVGRGVCRRLALVLMTGSGSWRGWLNSGWGLMRQSQIGGNGEAVVTGAYGRLLIASIRRFASSCAELISVCDK